MCRNIEHFDTIHKVRREYFKPPLPASTHFGGSHQDGLRRNYLIEINAIAVIPD